MNLTLVTGPAVEPLDLDEVKLHLRIDADDDDLLLGGLIQAAREQVEVVTKRALITQTWELSLEAWPRGTEMMIPLPVLQSVTSIKYKDQDGDESTMSSSDYIVDTVPKPGRVVLEWNKSWPSVTLYPASPITVRFVAGYGDTAIDVPRSIRQAMLLMIGEWYENREDITEARLQGISLNAERLLWPYRVRVVQ